MKKIESWRLLVPKDDKNAWNGTVTVTFDRDDLNCLVSAISSAYYEGVISKQDRDYFFNKLNIVDD